VGRGFNGRAQLDAGNTETCYIDVMKKQGSAKRKSDRTGSSGPVSLTLGRKTFAKISKVEGIELSAAMKQRAVDFDKLGTSAEERRTTIIRAYRKA